MAKPAIYFTMGLVVFLFGMTQLSAGVQLLMSARIRSYIRYSVRRPVYGLIIGTLSTILLQSSTATSVIAVGIVGAGLITFYHSLGILLGADIGTTLTVQLVVWKVTALSPLIIICGGALWISGKEKWKSLGEVIFYFGLMFFGLDMMAQATGPMKENADFVRFLKESRNPFLGLLAGLVFTAIVHASSIPISVLVILAQQGLIGIDNAMPVVFGANIGTTATVLLTAVTSNISGRRTAVAHFSFKAVGAVVALVCLPFFIDLLNLLSSNAAQQIALGHFLFNVLILLIFIFILKPFARFMEKIIPGEENVVPLWPEFLNERCLASPEQGLECVRKELNRQMVLARGIAQDCLQLINNYQEGKRRSVNYVKLVIHNLQKEIILYVWKISTHTLSGKHSNTLLAYTGMAHDIASIGSHAGNVVELSRQKHERHVDFTDAAKEELTEIGDLIMDNLNQAVQLIDPEDGGDRAHIHRIFANESRVDRLVQRSREKHLDRFHKRICSAEGGPIFVEVLINLERISDHCENMAEYFRDLQ